MMPMSIAFIIPDRVNPDLIGLDNVLNHTNKISNPFLSILGTRLYDAAKSGGINYPIEISNGDDIKPNTIYFVRDFFFNWLDKDRWNQANVESFGSHLVRLCALAEPNNNWLGAGFNALRSAKQGHFSTSAFYGYSNLGASNELNNIQIPLGCAAEWLPLQSMPSKSILLDEPHITVLDNLHVEDDIRTVLYKNALEVCRELHNRGFKISTFSREKNGQFNDFIAGYPFIEKISAGDWIPYKQLLSTYGEYPLFYSWFPETFGFSIYENLQIGNGIITYSEIANPCALRQMQNSACLSLYSKVSISADIVEDYYEKYVANNFGDLIREESHRAFSTNLFGERLYKIMNYNKLL
jgi:hypothetical protein